MNLTTSNFPKNVRLISTQRHLSGGVSRGNYANFNLANYVGDNHSAVTDNRALLVQHFGLPSAPKWLTQTHSNICLNAESSDCNGDAVIGDKAGVVCCVLTADCLPIFATNTGGTQVGVAHAGWQGIVAGVVESFVAQFDAQDLLVHLAPAISQQVFTVGAEVYQQLVDKNPLLSATFLPQGDKYQLDIYQVARIILNGLGVESITGGNECTYTQEDKYFSYRRDGAESGRMAHLIWIE